MEERLQKFLANSGIAARRKCEEYILQGRAKVNGAVVTELGTKIDPEKDTIEFDGKTIKLTDRKVYILLNKPIGYVTTVKDQFDRPTILDLVKVHEKVLPVGRLDMYTSGALLLTNDGDFIYRITHPKYEIEKTYTATVRGIVNQDDVEKLTNGVEIDDYVSSKAKVKILKTDEEKGISRLQITIHEGKNREVRKMCEAIGRKVLALHRRKIGKIDVKDMELGTWRYLTQKEIENFNEK